MRHVERRNDGDPKQKRLAEQYDDIAFQLIEAERKRINDLYRLGKLQDEARRRIERELDLREAQLSNVQGEE
jgi:monovalent cation/hydrogen antiporter